MSEKSATKSSTELGISEAHKTALMKTLEMLESGKLVHAQPVHWDDHTKPFVDQFNMSHWKDQFDCGTVCCLGSMAEVVGGVSFTNSDSLDLFTLFNPDVSKEDMNAITPKQAAAALLSYLTTGKPNWETVLGHRCDYMQSAIDAFDKEHYGIAHSKDHSVREPSVKPRS